MSTLRANYLEVLNTGSVIDIAALAALGTAVGSAAIGHTQAGVGAVARTVASKLRDVVTIEDFGGNPTPGYDNTNAFNRAHATGALVVYKAGTYELAGAPVVNGAFLAMGAGVGKTILKFTGVSQGVSVNANALADVFHVQGLSFVTTLLPGAGFTGLEIDGSAQISGTDGAGHGITGNRTDYRGSLRDVAFTGDSTGTGWNVGLAVRALPNFLIDGVLTRGRYLSAGNYQGVGILIGGDGIPIDWSIRRLWSYYHTHAVMIPDYVGGGHVYDHEIVHCTRGIWGGYDANWSTQAAGAVGSLGMHIDQGHINCRLLGVYLTNVNQALVANQNVYLNALSGDSSCVGVTLLTGDDNLVSGNRVNAGASVNTASGRVGLQLSGISNSAVHDNCLISGGSAISLVSNSNQNRVHDNAARSSINVVTSDGSCTANRLHDNEAYGNSGAKYAGLATANSVSGAVYAATETKTLTGGAANETISFAIPAGYYTAKPVVVDVEFQGGSSDPSIIARYVYDDAGNSATNVVVNVRLAGGGNLSSGTYRFGITVQGT